MMAASILGEILEHTREQVARQKRLGLAADGGEAPVPRSLRLALERGPRPALMAEIKTRSPSGGSLRQEVRVAGLARAYERAGASALSVLTNARYFGGSLAHLQEARRATALPVLRKDFILDPFQVEESRRAGADAVLLIAAALPGTALEELYACVRESGLEALVEVHEEAEMERAISLGADLIGINNRDLATLELDPAATARLAPLAPPGTTLVSESGLFRRQDVLAAARAGARAVLVGTALMASPDPEAKARELLGRGGR